MEIETEWRYSIETEAQRVLHAAHQIVVGFYRINNFFVLPANTKIKHSPKVVKFPDLLFNKISRFWEKAKLLDVYSKQAFVSKPLDMDQKLLGQIGNLLQAENLPAPNFNKTKATWEKASKELFDEIERVIPGKASKLKKIRIFPTVFGTTCSFSWTPDVNNEMFIFLRDDQDIYTITEAVLTSLTRKEVYENLNGTWAESELLVDWLITKSSINKVLKKYQPNSNFVPTLTGTRVKQNAKLLKESDTFYQKLGLSPNQKVFYVKNGVPTIGKKPAENLTLTEKLILKLLIEKANNVTSFDDLGNVLFKSVDEFSLYAISKQIERLRTKLEENGVSSSYIQTLRGQGYILKN